MWLSVVLLFCVVLWPGVTAKDYSSAKKYQGYKVYNLTINSVKKYKWIREYEGVKGYDFWKLPVQGNAHLMVAPELQSSFRRKMKENNIPCKLINEDVAESIDQESEPDDAPEEVQARAFGPFDAPSTAYNFKHFPRYREIKEFIKELVRDRKYSKMIKVGTSFEGRPIYGVEIIKSPDKPVFLVDAGIHAREWAAHISALFIIKKLVEQEDTWAEKMSFVIIPCINPDGYEYSHTVDRLWRKSRSGDEDSKCIGVDLNRNFDAHWGEFRADSNPCSDIYQGPNAFSEPESIALRDTILKYHPTAYLTIHSFGPLLLYPYGYTKSLPPEWKGLHQIAKNVADNIIKVNGTKYVVGTAARVLYEASGGSDDWAFDEALVPIVYTIELPEYEKKSFIVPKKYINTLVLETFVGFSTMVDNISERFPQ